MTITHSHYEQPARMHPPTWRPPGVRPRMAEPQLRWGMIPRARPTRYGKKRLRRGRMGLAARPFPFAGLASAEGALLRCVRSPARAHGLFV
jgi:hypothetical protein